MGIINTNVEHSQLGNFIILLQGKLQVYFTYGKDIKWPPPSKKRI